MNYWDFLSRPPPQLNSAMANLPTLWIDSILWTLGFCFAFEIISAGIKSSRSWYQSMSKEKREEWPSFAVCLLHHLRVVPLALLWIYQDLNVSAEATASVDYTAKEAQISSFCIGYLVSDTIYFTWWELMKGKAEMFVHHALILFLVLSTLYGEGSLCRFIPHLLVCDATGIPFNLAFLLRTVGLRDSMIVKFLEISFVVLFLLTRVINMPMMFFAMFQHEHNVSLGFARFVIPPICVLQWFWFAKILSHVFKSKPRDSPSRPPKVRKHD